MSEISIQWYVQEKIREVNQEIARMEIHKRKKNNLRVRAGLKYNWD